MKSKAFRVLIWIVAIAFFLFAVWFLSRVVMDQRTKSLSAKTTVSFSTAPIENVVAANKFSDFEGNIYQNKTGRLQLLHWNKNIAIAGFVQSIFPCDHGIGYVEDGTLYRYFDGDREKIAEKVAVACWDGDGFVWINTSNNAVMQQKNGVAKVLFQVDPLQVGSPIALLASERWVVLAPAQSLSGGTPDTFIYNRNTDTLTTAPLFFDGRNAAFLCGDRLIKVGGSRNRFCVMDLDSMALNNFNTDVIADQGSVTASAAYDEKNDVFYISVYSKPERPEFYDINTGTYAVDLKNGTIHKLNKKYYYYLCFSEDREKLYGATDLLGYSIVCRLHGISS